MVRTSIRGISQFLNQGEEGLRGGEVDGGRGGGVGGFLCGLW